MKKGYPNGIPFLFYRLKTATSILSQIQVTKCKRKDKVSSDTTLFLRFPYAKRTFSYRETYVSATRNVRFRAGKHRKVTDVSLITCSHPTNSLL